MGKQSMTPLKRVGNMKSAHTISDGGMFTDVARDFLESPNPKEATRKDADLFYEDDIMEAIDEAKGYEKGGWSSLADVAGYCGSSAWTIDDAVECMVGSGVPPEVAVGLGNTVARHAENAMDEYSQLEFPP